MTIASELTKLNTNLTNAYTAVSGKGGTLPQAQNFDNLATAISSIPSGGSAPVIESLNVTPTTSSQTISAPSGTDGYSPVNVAAVTANIDNNIVASNIKSGVSILGVSGSVTELKGETRSVSLTSSSGNTFTPSSGKNGITSITVTPNNQARTVTPSTSSESLTINSGYSGNGTITVNAVTSSIDANITAGNIKKDVSILGVIGTYEGSGGEFIGIQREVNNGTYCRPTSSFTFVLPSNATKAQEYVLNYAFYKSSGLTSVDLSSLTTASGIYALSYAFSDCPNLTSVDLSSLATVSGQSALYYAFNNCSNLTGNLDLSSLTTVSGQNALYYAFNGTKITSVDLSSLTTISGKSALYGVFRNCKNLTSISFPILTTLSGQLGLDSALSWNTNLTSISFPALKTTSFGSSYKNQFNNLMLSTGSTVTHTIHFPSNLQSTISGLTGYPLFGGSSGKVVLSFDLPATS